MTNPPEFYAARDNVQKGILSKRSMRTLKKHLAALTIRQPWEIDALGAVASLRKAEWLSKIEKEIEARKAKRQKTTTSILKHLLEGLLLAGILWFLSLLYRHVLMP